MAGSPSPRVFSAQLHFVALVTLLLVPIIAAAMFLAVRFSTTERERYTLDAMAVAERISASIDRKVLGYEEALAVFAAAALGTGGAVIPPSADAVRNAAAALSGTLIVKRADGSVLAASDGKAVPRGLTPSEQDAIASGEPAVSGLESADGGTPVVTVSVPLTDQPGSVGVISLSFSPKTLADILAAENLPEAWVGAIVDKNDLIVARSRQHERFLGAVATEDLRRNAVGERGAWKGTTKEGVAVLSAHVRSPVTGWRIATGVPMLAVEQPLRQSLFWITGVGLAGLSFSVLAAAMFGRRISRALTNLATAATAVGQATPLHKPAPTTIREINLIGDSIHHAAQELNKRAEARNRAENALATINGRLERVLNASPVGIVEFAPDRTITFANHAAGTILKLTRAELEGRKVDDKDWGIADINGRPIPPEDLPASRALRGETVFGYEFAISGPDGGEQTILSVNAIPVMDGDRLEGVLTAFTDVTKRLEVERHQRLLINELNHRVKNTLATVNSIAAQSLRSNVDTVVAREAFTGRIVALAQAHDVLTRERWEGADLRDIVTSAVEPHDGERFGITGVPVRLAPQTALSVAMALHELSTNAVKYGALSVQGGHVRISWVLVPAGPVKRLQFRWQEIGGPPVEEPARRGFGSRMIETGLSRELDGEVRILFEPDGVVCTIDAPLEDA
ncbi:sensor histidine kinase [Chthonobacter albigriseus]|uniref:sensor histidine kinase n=1 Tax=Chthonobacter albigriseus TaxID=1683161 RepID=UPI0015EFA20C|nr:HWE histidine kinase domain-containing protein [Chthonobacter albigriseus]